MIVFATIIAEELHGHWSAWFNNESESSYGGAHSAEAIERLLQANGRENYDTNQMYPILERTRDGHLEFQIVYVGNAD